MYECAFLLQSESILGLKRYSRVDYDGSFGTGIMDVPRRMGLIRILARIRITSILYFIIIFQTVFHWSFKSMKNQTISSCFIYTSDFYLAYIIIGLVLHFSDVAPAHLLCTRFLVFVVSLLPYVFLSVSVF